MEPTESKPEIITSAPVTSDPLIDEMLKGYENVTMSVDPEKGADPDPVQEPAAPPRQPTAAELADPTKYFQSGKKKGQPKPAARNRTANTLNAAGLGTGDSMNVPVSDLLTGALFISLIDILVPLLIEVVNNRFSDDKIKASDLTLTAEQQKRLTPIADELVKRLNLDLHPGILLILGLASIYGLNFAAVKSISKQ